MAFHALKNIVQRAPNVPNFTIVRHGHRMRGKPPGVARSLKQRLADENPIDETLHFKVDIGLPQLKRSRTKELAARLAHLKAIRSDKNFEKLARTGQLIVPLDKTKETWWETSGPYQVRQIAQHYDVFDHLFGDAYFTPRISLNINYPQGDDKVAPVFYGNVLKPSEVKTQPNVSYTSNPETLWTLALTNPDGHFTQNGAEYVHWLVGNIPGSDVDKGEVVWDYLQPFPPRGTGFQRLIFILYQQNQRLDFSKLSKKKPCLLLKDRTFNTLEFYRERQDIITPTGLAFFQSDWDPSLQDFFHNTLRMKEPIYEYDFPEPYIRPQEWFPLRKPFNLYMDKYRDPKQIAKEYLLKKLDKQHPFQPPTPPKPFPNAERLPRNTPSWLALELKKNRLGWGRINDV